MGSGAVKTIVLLMVLVVFSFIIGAQVSDNVKDSIGAFIIVGAVIGVSLLVYMGPRVWQLLFILPPFVELLPIPHASHAITTCGMAPFYVSMIVLPYWLILWSLGRARFCWRWAAVLDIPFMIFVGFMVVAYVRHPVALDVMGLDYDSIGGEEVIVLIFLLSYYVALSVIPISKQELEKCLQTAFKFFMVAGVLFAIRGTVFRHQLHDTELAASGLVMRRFYAFFPLGSCLFFWAYSKYPVSKMLGSVRCWAISLFAAAATLLTAQRQNMALMACGVVFIAAVKREICILILSLVAAYAGVLYLGEMNMLSHLPGGAQRALSAVPGVKLHDSVLHDGDGTMQTRYSVWTYALNPRTGAIKNHMWGDGFALSRAYKNRANIAYMRGTSRGTADMDAMTISRNFHNGAIHTISRIGYVGLAWCAIMCIIAWGVSIQVLRVWYRTETYPYIMLGIIHMPIILLTYGYANYVTRYYMCALQSFIFLKLCYCIARENGLLRPLFGANHYVPMMIQETEKTSAGRVAPAA